MRGALAFIVDFALHDGTRGQLTVETPSSCDALDVVLEHHGVNLAKAKVTRIRPDQSKRLHAVPPAPAPARTITSTGPRGGIETQQRELRLFAFVEGGK